MENSKEANDNIEHSRPKYTHFNYEKDYNLFYCPDFLKLLIKGRLSRIKALVIFQLFLTKS